MKYLIFTLFICNVTAMDNDKISAPSLSVSDLFPILYNQMHKTGSLKDFKEYSAELNKMPERDLRRLRTAWLLLKKESKEQAIAKTFSPETVEELDKIIQEEDEQEDRWEITCATRDGISMRMMQKRTPSPICISALTPVRASSCRAPSPLHQRD